MDEVLIDKSQIIGEVKERNKLYKALVKIQEITKKATERKTEGISCMNEIEIICKETLKDII